MVENLKTTDHEVEPAPITNAEDTAIGIAMTLQHYDAVQDGRVMDEKRIRGWHENFTEFCEAHTRWFSKQQGPDFQPTAVETAVHRLVMAVMANVPKATEDSELKVHMRNVPMERLLAGNVYEERLRLDWALQWQGITVPQLGADGLFDEERIEREEGEF